MAAARSVRACLALALGLPACDACSSGPDTTAPSAKPSTSSSPSGPSARLGGDPLDLRYATAMSQGTSAIWLSLSTHPLPCERVGPMEVGTRRGEKLVVLMLARTLDQDGAIGWSIPSASFYGTPLPGGRPHEGAKVSVSEADVTKTVRAEIDVTIDGRSGPSMVLQGDVTAKGCGTKLLNAPPQANPQRRLKVTVANKPFDIRGAVLRKKKGDRQELELSTRPRVCEGHHPAGDFVLRLSLEGDPLRARRAYLSGALIGGAHHVGHEPHGTFTAGVPVDGGQGLRVAYSQVIGGFAVEVSGVATPHECAR